MGQLEKARIYAADSNESYQFYVQFNPNEISIEENVGNHGDRGVHKKTEGIKGGKRGAQSSPFTDKAEAQFSTKLFFNTYESDSSYTDVRAQIKQFYFFYTPGAASISSKKIGFAWGSLIITGVLTGMQVSYSMFASNGTPVRAEVSIRISGDYSDRQSNEVGNAQFVELTVKGTSLMERLKSYKDPTGWRELMEGDEKPLPEHNQGIQI